MALSSVQCARMRGKTGTSEFGRYPFYVSRTVQFGLYILLSEVKIAHQGSEEDLFNNVTI